MTPPKRYDLVLHLVTAANGAEAFYTNANNTARRETAEEARDLDSRILKVFMNIVTCLTLPPLLDSCGCADCFVECAYVTRRSRILDFFFLRSASNPQHFQNWARVHPHVAVLDNSSDFDGKCQRTMEAVRTGLNAAAAATTS